MYQKFDVMLRMISTLRRLLLILIIMLISSACLLQYEYYKFEQELKRVNNSFSTLSLEKDEKQISITKLATLVNTSKPQKPVQELDDIITLDVDLYNDHSSEFNKIDGEDYLLDIIFQLYRYAPEGMQISAAAAMSYTEGGAGKQGVYKQTNNCFGIKAGPSWKGFVYDRTTQVVYKDYETAKKYGAGNDLFRAYSTMEESVKDYINLISIDRYRECLTAETPENYLIHLLNNGYGEKTSYSVWLYVINIYDLESYDLN